MKRFYKLVSHSKGAGGYGILLDNKPVKTPGRAELLAPNEKLADLIVQEWAGQGEEIDADSMPLTQILNTKIDRVAASRAALEPEILKYLNTDLLCYHAPDPESLVAKQQELWRPWLDWFEKRFGGIKLETTTGFGALTHPQAAHDAVKKHVEELDNERFTILQLVTPLSGSLILALAFTEQAAKAEDLMKAAFLEEDFKAELCNEDEYGADPLTDKKRKTAERDLAAALLYLDAIKGSYN